ncbi:MAG TPA: glycosyltransferase [Acidimicrobiia bacterium]|nr:glycosyltransferase [Acidimicrobiia bacterium]
MTAVHQFVPTLAPRDAVGRHYLAIQETLRAAGYRSDIYSYEAKDEYKRLAKPFTSFTGGAPNGSRGESTWLLYHSSVGSTVADFVAARDEPLIVDYHNITPAPFFARWEPALAGALMKGRRQLASLESRAALGMADSAFNAQELTDLGYARTSVVPILLDIEALDATPADPKVLDQLTGAKSRGGVDWLFVGRLAPNKAQHDVVKAFAAYRRLYDDRARLHLVGASSSHRYELALSAFIGALDLGDSVDVTGGVSAGALTAYFEAADVYVTASEHEGFCVPLLEAMHHRVPIVAHAAAAVPETLGDAGLLLDAKDAYTIASAVHRVVDESALRKQLVEAGVRRLRDFDLEKSRKKLLDALEPVVGSPK